MPMSSRMVSALASMISTASRLSNSVTGSLRRMSGVTTGPPGEEIHVDEFGLYRFLPLLEVIQVRQQRLVLGSHEHLDGRLGICLNVTKFPL